jgi:predicted O-methyltransferase YrrM
MANRLWDAVDAYFGGLIVRPGPALDAALAASDAAGLPAIGVAPNQGKLLKMVALMVGARRILEIGTLGGYSTIWMAQALPPDGKLISLEVDPEHARVARANIEAAGLGGIVDVRVGPALQTLPRLAEEGAGPFDLVFIDADKPNNPKYLEWALKLTRKGSAIVIDNVVRDGAVADPASRDFSVLGARRVTEMISREPRLTATALQTVGSKGYDGLILALVTG